MTLPGRVPWNWVANDCDINKEPLKNRYQRTEGKRVEEAGQHSRTPAGVIPGIVH